MFGLGAVSVALLLAAGKAADSASADLVGALLRQNTIHSQGDDADARPPTADAPLDVLVAYWRNWRKAAPSPEVAARLLVACEHDPVVVPELIELLPETDGANDRIKVIWDQHHARFGAQWSKQVVSFLMGRSRYFRDDLEKAAAAAHDEAGYVDGSDALEQLVRLDWARAAPLLTRFAAGNQRRRAALAVALTYKHQVATGGPAAGEQLRAKLKAIVAERRPGFRARRRVRRAGRHRLARARRVVPCPVRRSDVA